MGLLLIFMVIIPSFFYFTTLKKTTSKEKIKKRSHKSIVATNGIIIGIATIIYLFLDYYEIRIHFVIHFGVLLETSMLSTAYILFTSVDFDSEIEEGKGFFIYYVYCIFYFLYFYFLYAIDNILQYVLYDFRDSPIFPIVLLLSYFLVGFLANFLITVFFLRHAEKESANKDEEEELSDYRFCILVLLARVMNADGKKMKCELDAVKSAIRKYYFTEEEQKAALKQFQSILNNIDKYKKYNLSEICNPINEHFQYNKSAKSELVTKLLQVAFADKDNLFREENEIFNIVSHLEFSLDEYKRLLDIYKKKNKQKKSNTNNEQEKSETNSNNNKNCNFRDSILRLLAEVMKADGKQMKCELDRVKATIRRYYQTEEERLAALKQFQSILNDKKKANVIKLCNIINQKFDYAAKSELIMELLAVAYADDNFSEIEASTINKIVTNLQISRKEYKSIKNIFRKKYNQGEYKYDENRNEYNESNDNKKKDENKNKSKSNSNRSKSGNISVSEAYDILKVEGNASDAEVKKAYRVLAMMYHPDKVSSLGDEAIRQATESMKQINAAWDVVKEARGMR